MSYHQTIFNDDSLLRIPTSPAPHPKPTPTPSIDRSTTTPSHIQTPPALTQPLATTGAQIPPSNAKSADPTDNTQSQPQPTPSQQPQQIASPFVLNMFAAGCGSVITGLTMTPLDVLGKRIQAEKLTNPTHSTATITKTFNKIRRTEGISRLWAGLGTVLAMAVPNTIIYFSTYEYLRSIFVKLVPQYHRRLLESNHSIFHNDTINSLLLSSSLPPFLAGVFSRLFCTTLVAPLELIRTRQQTFLTPKSGGSGGDLGVPTFRAIFHDIVYNTNSTLPQPPSPPQPLSQSLPSQTATRIGAVGMVGKTTTAAVLAAETKANGVQSSTTSRPDAGNKIDAAGKAVGGKVRARFGNLYRGLGTTLWRDVPFSALYWSFNERCKGFLTESDFLCTVTNSCMVTSVVDGENKNNRNGTNHTHSNDHNGQSHLNTNNPTSTTPPAVDYSQRIDRDSVKERSAKQTWAISFISGATAGTLASIITHPFEVIKTAQQFQYNPTQLETYSVDLSKANLWATYSYITRTTGFRSLFVGLLPRTLKIAPSCAVMLSSYDLAKTLLGNKPNIARSVTDGMEKVRAGDGKARLD